MTLFRLSLAVAAFSLTAALSPASADDPSIIVQSTTSTANSGLYDHLLPLFKKRSGVTVNVVAVGTGQAIRNAQNCDGDVLLVHARAAEETFVEAGLRGRALRSDVTNDFVIVGPADDPAGIDGAADVTAALGMIAETPGAVRLAQRRFGAPTRRRWPFGSRRRIDPTGASGDWYRETGSGMGATLNTGIGMGAYVLTDRATWISFENKQDFRIVVEGDEALFNQYGVILVNPERCPNVEAIPGQAFVDWLRSPEGQDAIQAYRIDGQQLFFPNALPGQS